jgi:hypothetical protein
MRQEDPLPPPGSSFEEWTPYALAFDGYEHAGGHEQAAAVWKAAADEIERSGTVTGSYEFLRTALFYHQRLHHDAWLEGEDAVRVQCIADALLAALTRRG